MDITLIRAMLDYVKPGGFGSGSEDHRVLYNYAALRDLFVSAGFEVKLLEYWDERGQFHYLPWNPQDGLVHRSRDFDDRNRQNKLSYTSIILDAVKG